MSYCAVLNCANGRYRLNKWKAVYCQIHGCNFGTSRCICPPPFILFPFPTTRKDPEARARWIKAVNRADKKEPLKLMTPSKSQRVCSEHFVVGRPTAQYPDPEVKLGYSSLQSKKKTAKRQYKFWAIEDKLHEHNYSLNSACPNIKPYKQMEPTSGRRASSKHFVRGRPTARHPNLEMRHHYNSRQLKKKNAKRKYKLQASEEQLHQQDYTLNSSSEIKSEKTLSNDNCTLNTLSESKKLDSEKTLSEANGTLNHSSRSKEPKLNDIHLFIDSEKNIALLTLLVVVLWALVCKLTKLVVELGNSNTKLETDNKKLSMELKKYKQHQNHHQLRNS